jgi:aminoglycoside/choline kinase family phosphotransferase
MPEAPAAVAEYLSRARIAGARVVPLTGDASDRKYFRILPPDGAPVVLAVHAAPFEFASLPFVRTAALFTAMPVPVPRILGHAEDVGVLALQDLGDVTLQAHLGAATPARHASLYRRAVALIEIIQRRGAALASPEFPAYGIAFDVEKLGWEMDFFVKHFLEAYRGVALAPAARAALRQELALLVEELAAEPRVLCHRDYHSRNLMLHGDELCIIDFQDARMGPDTYDLASLLRDSYVDLPEASVDELIAYFLALQQRPAAQAEFRRRFDLMALQRNLKALGTFGYQTTARQNPVYIQYMPRTLSYVAGHLRKHARFARLAELLAPHLDELRDPRQPPAA